MNILETDKRAQILNCLVEGCSMRSAQRLTGVAKKTGRPLKAPFVHSWTVSHGRILRFVQYTDTVAWRQALGLA